MRGYRYTPDHGGLPFDMSKYALSDVPDQLDWRLYGEGLGLYITVNVGRDTLSVLVCKQNILPNYALKIEEILFSNKG